MLNKPKQKIDPANNNLIGWLNVSVNDSEERAYAQVRDIDETIEVIVLRKINGEYLNDSMEIAKQTIRLNKGLLSFERFDKIIEDLEKYNIENLSYFQKDPWLKGKLGIILDENNEFILGDIFLKYDEKLGLFRGEEANEKI